MGGILARALEANVHIGLHENEVNRVVWEHLK